MAKDSTSMILDRVPDKPTVVILSGGMDSTIALRLCVEKLGADNVKALSFYYGQKQKVELVKAAESTAKLGVEHQVVDITFLGKFSQGFSANVDDSIAVPSIEEVLGDPQPKTYVPNRNMIMLSIAASYAETHSCEYIVTGLQVHDTYGYWDTTQAFVDAMNSVLSNNRHNKIKIIAPFVDLSKREELEVLLQLDGNLNLLHHTLTCYNPTAGISCGVCPSCAERIAAFMSIGQQDPIEYSIPIGWNNVRNSISV